MDASEEETRFCVRVFCLSEDQLQGGIQVAKDGQHRDLLLQVSPEGKGVSLVLMDGK